MKLPLQRGRGNSDQRVRTAGLFAISVRRAAVLGRSNIYSPSALALPEDAPTLRPAAPEDGRTPRIKSAPERGSVLIIVLWVAFGLVSVALYFAHSMTFELRASDNRLAGLEAEQAIEGAARYAGYVLANLGTNGAVPDPVDYHREAWPLGDARFWFIGRGDQQVFPTEPTFGLVEEAAKLNLNTATLEMLQLLPRMTPELAAAIVDWRDADSNPSPGGAESEIYQRQQPAYKCKNAPFETVDELRHVSGINLEVLFGEDLNLNGVLDLNENDGNVSLPDDDRDGQLDPGLLEYVTVFSRQPNNRTNVNQVQQQLAPLLNQAFGAERANQILQQIGGGPAGPGIRSVLEFYIRSRMSAEEFAQIETRVTAVNGAYLEGLVNAGTASAEVLACLPGIGTDKAQLLVSYRLSNPDKLNSLAWIAEVLDRSSAIQAGPYLTAECYQFTADIAAVGHHSRGYGRARFVFDTSEGTPKVLFRKDLAGSGWALGKNIRQNLLLAKETR